MLEVSRRDRTRIRIEEIEETYFFIITGILNQPGPQEPSSSEGEDHLAAAPVGLQHAGVRASPAPGLPVHLAAGALARPD